VKNTKINLNNRTKGQVSLQKLKAFVLAFVVIGVAGTVGLDVMGTLQHSMTNDVTVLDESSQPSTPLPSSYTVDKASDGDFRELENDSVSVVFYDASASSNTTLTEDTDYVVTYSSGSVEIQDTTTTSSYNTSEGDKFYTDYTAILEDSQAQKGANNAIDGMNELLGFLPVIGLVVAAAVVIGLVSGFGGSRSGRRTGRA
jgi:hypothetical protein